MKKLLAILVVLVIGAVVYFNLPDGGCNGLKKHFVLYYQMTCPEQCSLIDEYVPLVFSFQISSDNLAIIKSKNDFSVKQPETGTLLLDNVDFFNDPHIEIKESSLNPNWNDVLITIQFPTNLLNQNSGTVNVELTFYKGRTYRRSFDYTKDLDTNMLYIQSC